MKKAMQLKAIVNNFAKKNKIAPQLAMQNFMFEHLLERISVSQYRNNFVLKGGFLISSIVGITSRATMDMDITLKHFPLSKKVIENLFSEISKIDIDDNINFSFISSEKIRKKDEYSGYRISFTADYPPMKVPLKIDITTGDAITPKEINYKFNLLFKDKSINILAYNIETILAEKLETIISRADQNTRPRDFYDVYILTKLQSKNINNAILNKALIETAKRRNSLEIIMNYKEIINTITNSDIMINQWERYRKDFDYANYIDFKEICNVLTELMKNTVK